MTLDDIFSKENWDKYLTNSKSWAKKSTEDSFQTLAEGLQNTGITNEIGLVEKSKKILKYLNQVTGKNYTDYDIIAKGLTQGRTYEEHIKVIDIKKY